MTSHLLPPQTNASIQFIMSRLHGIEFFTSGWYISVKSRRKKMNGRKILHFWWFCAWFYICFLSSLILFFCRLSRNPCSKSTAINWQWDITLHKTALTYYSTRHRKTRAHFTSLAWCVCVYVHVTCRWHLGTIHLLTHIAGIRRSHKYAARARAHAVYKSKRAAHSRNKTSSRYLVCTGH
jgi:hypothetical protein